MGNDQEYMEKVKGTFNVSRTLGKGSRTLEKGLGLDNGQGQGKGQAHRIRMVKDTREVGQDGKL